MLDTSKRHTAIIFVSLLNVNNSQISRVFLGVSFITPERASVLSFLSVRIQRFLIECRETESSCYSDQSQNSRTIQ